MKPFQLKPNRAAAVEAEERQIDRETGEYSQPLSSILASSVVSPPAQKRGREAASSLHIQVKLFDAQSAHTQKCFAASSPSSSSFSSSITFHQTCLKFQARTCQDNNVRANRWMSMETKQKKARTTAAAADCERNLCSPRSLLSIYIHLHTALDIKKKVRQIKLCYTLYPLKLNKSGFIRFCTCVGSLGRQSVRMNASISAVCRVRQLKLHIWLPLDLKYDMIL